MKRGLRTAALLFWAALVALAAPGLANAQGVTTSAIGGRITSAQGEGVSGVQVTVTNRATGAVSRVTTRQDGRYFIPGLQPGTYRVSTSGIGYAAQVRDNVTLTLGQTATFDFTVAAEAVALEGLTVTAEAENNVISRGRTGTSAVVSDSTLRRAPTITRDLQDFTRLVPQIAVTNSTTGAVSGAGRNNRFNQLQIDGTASNDLFGLSASGSPGGQAGGKAITLEAIQELQVVIAPFDVRQGGFTGASINAVTRSGTNDFRGSVAGFTRNENLAGRFVTYADTTSAKLEQFENTELAGSFGGPILRDRAFFFFAGERTLRSDPTNFLADSDPSRGVTLAQAEEVRQFLSGLGYDPGTAEQVIRDREGTNLFGRLDFNLGSNNRLTLRHNYNDGFREDFSRSGNSYTLGNGGYIQNNTTHSSVVQLNSSLGNGLFNELRLGYNRVRDERTYGGGNFPRVLVGPTNARVLAGTENFSGLNELSQDAFEFTNDLTIPFGAHTFTLGTSNEFSEFSNLFVRNPFGYYEFNNFTNLQAGTPSRYEFSYLCRTGLPNCQGAGRPRAEFDVRRYAVYAQDRWDVFDNLQLTGGVRLDITQLPTDPGNNQLVRNLYGRSTADVPETTVLFNPRVGFNWDVSGDQTTQVRGGGGLFSGRTPYVWLSNAYGNTGLDYVRFSCTGSNVPAFVANPATQPQACTGTTNATPNEINLIDPDLSPPQVSRFSLGVDQELPFGLIGTVEGLYTKTINDVLYRNLRVSPDSLGRMVEGRPRYQTRSQNSTPGLGDIIDITNTEQGYSYNFTAQIQRPFRDGWDFSAAYTNSRSKDVNPLGSSQAISNWRFNVTSDDPNNPGLRLSDFDIPHRVVLQTTRSVRFFDRFATDFSLVYVGQSGRPFSVRYDGDVNFDGSFGNDALLVPATAADVRFSVDTIRGQVITPAQSWENLNAFIEDVDCLRENRGKVVKRNACREPWSNRFDLRVAQNVSPFGRQSLQLTLDILNVGNLINEEWGLQQFVSNQTLNVLQLDTRSGVNNQPDAQGRRVYRGFDQRDSPYTISGLDSRYQIQLGARYSF